MSEQKIEIDKLSDIELVDLMQTLYQELMRLQTNITIINEEVKKRKTKK